MKDMDSVVDLDGNHEARVVDSLEEECIPHAVVQLEDSLHMEAAGPSLDCCGDMPLACGNVEKTVILAVVLGICGSTVTKRDETGCKEGAKVTIGRRSTRKCITRPARGPGRVFMLGNTITRQQEAAGGLAVHKISW